MVTIEDIAIVCHEVNRAYCEATGDFSQKPWAIAPIEFRNSAINGVKFHLANPSAQPSDSHNSWLKERGDSGWTWGPVKDLEAKEHPCFMPYDDLPVAQKAKDYLFIAVVRSMAKHIIEF